MLAARTIAEKRVLSVGDLRVEYPEAPRNKPYRSILTIPVIGRDDEVILGVVSVDCSRPYSFQSFQQGVIENELENDLLPYLQTLALVLEALVSSDRRAIVTALRRHACGELSDADFLRELRELDASRRRQPHWLMQIGGVVIAVLGVLLVPASGRRD